MSGSGGTSAAVFWKKGHQKKQVARETGVSRRTINKMLTHEHPPGYGPRPLRYPKLEPYIQTIDRLLHDTISFPPGANLTIRDIVEHLRRDEGFAGSYDSVRNYIRQRARDDESAWDRAYDLIVQLPKPRALDLIGLDVSNARTPLPIGPNAPGFQPRLGDDDPPVFRHRDKMLEDKRR